MKLHISILIFLLSICCWVFSTQPTQAALNSYILLSDYCTSLNIGEEFCLFAFSSGRSAPTFKSSNSRIASVNIYGHVTAKKGGVCKITAKTSSAQASCTVRVKKTRIALKSKAISMERGESITLVAKTSNGSIPTYSSNKKSVAIVDENGLVNACKPGVAMITIKADGTSINCKVTVKKPMIRLNRLYAKLYRCQSVKLKATVSSGIAPVWKSNRTSVATVNQQGIVTARKHGSALITAKVDGITKICEIVVESPQILLSKEEIRLRSGQSTVLGIQISSGNAPSVKSSKPAVAKVDLLGNIIARQPGKTIITVSEDGTKEQCIVYVTE